MSIPAALSTGLVDRYHIERELGQGGMATVFLARDLKHDRHVALKVLRPEIAASLGAERFLAEIRLTARLQHPHIVPLFDSGEANGALYYVMPYLKGESLRTRLEREPRFDVEAMLSVARPVAEALAYAHELGIVHRDIKPENILLCRGQPFVTDFGIARAVSMAAEERLTVPGMSIGTPAYMSPEQAVGQAAVDGRSDVYSLGCVIYEMLSGKPPFSGPTVQALIGQRLAGPPAHLTTVPASVDAVVRRALATAPQDRFQTALALADALVEAGWTPVTLEKSIVVLPFDDLSPGSDNQYFSDGLTEEIIADLSMLDALRVISRTTAMQLRGTDRSVREIARLLDVQYVLEGSVRKAGNRLRITAQLIDGQSDKHVWAEKYDGVLKDVFEIQEQVSCKIVEALKGKVSQEDSKQLAARPSFQEVGVYEAYARARFELWRTEPASQKTALGLLEEAVEAFGEHPLLISGIGAVHWQFYHQLGHLEEGHLEKVEECTSKLFAMDPTSPHGHRLSSYLRMAAGRSEDAIHHLRHALEGDPSDSESLLWLSYFLAAHAGKPALAHPVAEHWVALDPLNPVTQSSRMVVQWANGNPSAALEYAREWCRLDPGNRIAKWYCGIMLAWAGRFEESYRQAEELTAEDPDEVMGQVLRCLTLALRGEKDEARGAISDESKSHCLVDFGLPWFVADAYAAMEDTEEALYWLERTVANGVFNYPMLSGADPFLASVRSDDRFQQLMTEVKERWEAFSYYQSGWAQSRQDRSERTWPVNPPTMGKNP